MIIREVKIIPYNEIPQYAYHMQHIMCHHVKNISFTCSMGHFLIPAVGALEKKVLVSVS